MNGPRRWLDDAGELSALERRVLQSAERMRAPVSSKRQVWSALAAQLPLLSAVSGDPTPASAAASGAPAASGAQAVLAGAVLKAVAVGFTLGAVSVGAVAGLAPSKSAPHSRPEASSVTVQQPAAEAARVSPPSSPAPFVAPAETVVEGRLPRPPQPEAARAVQPEREPEREAVHVEPAAARAAFPDAQPAVAAGARPASSAASSSVLDRARLESQRVAEARGLLRAGNPGQALRLLSAISTEFPSGVLVQERESLIIDALLSSGQREEARQRAQDFLSRYPGSPHTLSAQRALQ